VREGPGLALLAALLCLPRLGLVDHGGLEEREREKEIKREREKERKRKRER
jgi:hypothetical protein